MSAQSILIDGKIEAACIAAATPNFSISTLTCTTINNTLVKAQWLAAGTVSTFASGGVEVAEVNAGPAAVPGAFGIVVTPAEPLTVNPAVYVSTLSSTWVTFTANPAAPGKLYNWAAYNIT
jgi:hypothetical protein